MFFFGLDYETIVGSELVYVVSDYVLNCWVLVINESSSDLIFDKDCVFSLHKDIMLETLDRGLERLDFSIGCVEVILGDALEVFDVHLILESLKIDWVLSWEEGDFLGMLFVESLVKSCGKRFHII